MKQKLITILIIYLLSNNLNAQYYTPVPRESSIKSILQKKYKKTDNDFEFFSNIRREYNEIGLFKNGTSENGDGEITIMEFGYNDNGDKSFFDFSVDNRENIILFCDYYYDKKHKLIEEISTSYGYSKFSGTLEIDKSEPRTNKSKYFYNSKDSLDFIKVYRKSNSTIIPKLDNRTDFKYNDQNQLILKSINATDNSFNEETEYFYSNDLLIKTIKTSKGMNNSIEMKTYNDKGQIIELETTHDDKPFYYHEINYYNKENKLDKQLFILKKNTRTRINFMPFNYEDGGSISAIYKYNDKGFVRRIEYYKDFIYIAKVEFEYTYYQ